MHLFAEAKTEAERFLPHRRWQASSQRNSMSCSLVFCACIVKLIVKAVCFLFASCSHNIDYPWPYKCYCTSLQTRQIRCKQSIAYSIKSMRICIDDYIYDMCIVYTYLYIYTQIRTQCI